MTFSHFLLPLLLSLSVSFSLLPSLFSATINHNWAVNSGPFNDVINVGDTIIWSNIDGLTHNIVTQAGSNITGPDSGDMTMNGDLKAFTFKVVGYLSYQCAHYPQMVGTVTVNKASNPGNGQSNTLVIPWAQGIQFSQTVLVGTTVQWVWSDNAPHNVNSMSSNWQAMASSPTPTAPYSYSYFFNNTGTYTADCIIHGQNMMSTIIVALTLNNSTPSPSAFINWQQNVQTTVTIKPGQLVRWVWSDTAPHTVSATSANWFAMSNSNVQTAPYNFDYLFTNVGVYTSDCYVHGTSMKATVIVTNGAGGMGGINVIGVVMVAIITIMIGRKGH